MKSQKPASWQSWLLALSASVFLVFLALYAGVFAMVDAFSLTVDASAVTQMCLLFALLSALLYSVPRQSLCTGLLFVACGLLALYTWGRWEAFANGARVLFHQVSLGFHQAIPSILFYELPRALSHGYQRQCATVFLSVAIPLLALWVCPWLTLGWPVWPAVGAVAGLMIVPLLILVQPSPLTLAAFLLFLSLVILSRKGFRESAVTGAKRVFAALVPVALVMALLGALLPAGFNPRPMWLEDLRLSLQALPNSDFALGIGGNKTVIPGEQDFSSAGPLRFNGHTVLQIRTNSRERQLLLRGFSAGQYTARGWMPLNTDSDPYPLIGQTDSRSPFNYPYQSQPYVDTATIRIIDMASYSDYYYIPYYPSELPQDAAFVQDSYLERPSGTDEYYFSFAPPSQMNSTATIDSANADAAYYAEYQYRQWVRRNYLDVPYDLLSDEAAEFIRFFEDPPFEHPGEVELALPGGGVTTWCWADVYSDGSDQYTRYMSTANAISDLLASFTEYDQSTPVTPAGEDFVSHFLTNSRRGYCLHYASAATLMLRSIGIPTRFTSGYVARSSRPNSVVNVPDRNAHAWVEIYIDGFGWQPVDVTPGFSGGGNLADFEGTHPSASPSPSPSAATPTPSPTPSPTQATPSPAPSTRLPHTLSAPLLYFLYTLLALLAVILLFGLIYLQYRLRLSRLSKKCADPDTNKAVIALYRYLLALERRAKVPIPQTPVDLAQKAHFSQHIITIEELSRMQTFAKAAAQTAKLQPLFRRLRLKYLFALL